MSIQHRNINRFPFRGFVQFLASPLRSPIARFLKDLTPRLGSANSQLIAIFEIPLFTSVEKGFHFSNYYYYQDLHYWLFQAASQRPFRKTNTSFYSCPRATCTAWRGISLRLERYPFSGHINSAGELLHIPWPLTTSMSTAQLSKLMHTFCGI